PGNASSASSPNSSASNSSLSRPIPHDPLHKPILHVETHEFMERACEFFRLLGARLSRAAHGMAQPPYMSGSGEPRSQRDDHELRCATKHSQPLSEAKDLTGRSDTIRAACVRSFAPLRTTVFSSCVRPTAARDKAGLTARP